MTSLLETKLYMPQPAGDFVARSGVYEYLDQGLHRKLTLMSAPAGFGKSTTAVMWLQRLLTGAPSSTTHVRVAWYALDERDNDLPTFVRYLVAAVRGADINLLEGWIDLDSRPTTRNPEEIAAELLARLTTESQHRQSKVIIALDDYHCISSEEVHRFVAYLLRRLPVTIHVAILTRLDPPLGLPQLRVRGEVSDIRANQLAFTREEAGRFLHDSVAADMEAQTIDALWRQTEGWAAGLRLAAISMHGTDDRANFVLRFAQHNSRHVADYLTEEVLSRQPADVYAFLLRTSVLERMCDELCAAVVGNMLHNGEPFLTHLERRGLFLLPLDEFGEWYRYHGQFRTMLQNRLQSQVPPAEIKSLHAAAARWLEEQGLIEEALLQYAAGAAYSEAGTLLERQIPELLRREQWRQAERWLQLLPSYEIKRRPNLLLLRAWLCYRDLNYLQVSEIVAEAEAVLAVQGAEPTSQVDILWGQIHALRATSACPPWTPDEAIAHGQAALRLLPPEYDWVRAFAINVLAQPLAVRDGFDAGLQLVRTELASARAVHREYTLRLQFAEATLQYFRGHISAFFDAIQRLEELAYSLDVPVQIQWANWAAGTVHLERNELAPAIERFATLFERADLALFQTLRMGGFSLLSLYAQLGKNCEGDKILAILHQRLERNPDPFARAEIEAMDALWALLNGNLQAAEAYARGASNEILPFNAPYRGNILVHIHHALGSAEDLTCAITIAEQSLSSFRSIRHVRAQITWLVLLAQTLWLAGREVRALAALRDALTLGYPLGFRNVYTGGLPATNKIRGEMLRRLAREPDYAACSGSLLADMARMVEAGEQLQKPDQAGTGARRWRGDGETLIEPLSNRELEVLGLIAQHLSNKEIAYHLHISHITVRNHTVRIYEKLHVESRRQAVARAQQLGMLPPA